MKSVMYTDDQLKAIKTIVEYSENFADVLYKSIVDHGLDLTDGCHLKIEINPGYNFVTRVIEFGEENKPSGHVTITKGKTEEEYVPTGSANTPEYSCLFTPEGVRSRIRAILQGSETPPTDSVWLRGDADDSDLDSGVSVDDMANG